MNRNLIFAVIGVVVLGAAFYMVGLKPKRQEAAELQTQITAKQGELDQARQLLASNQKARENYQAAYATVVRLGKAVPSDDDVRSLMVQLNSAASHSGVDFRSINVGGPGGATVAPDASGSAAATSLPPGATVGPSGFPIMPFSFAFTGSFFNLGDFFDRIDKFVKLNGAKLDVNGRLMTLDSLQLAPDGTGFPHIRATVGATTYLTSPVEGSTGGATAQGPAGSGGAAGGTTPQAPASSAPAPATATSTGGIG